MSLRAALHPPTREERLWWKRKTCPACRKKFATATKFREHVWSALIAADLDVTPEEAVKLYREHGPENLIRRDENGEPVVVPPEASG